MKKLFFAILAFMSIVGSDLYARSCCSYKDWYNTNNADIYFPGNPHLSFGLMASGNNDTCLLDAAAERCTFIGRAYVNGGSGSANCTAAGGCSIRWLPGTSIAFTGAGTSLDVGIQGVAAAAGSPNQPDGTYTVNGTLVGGTDTITASTSLATDMETETGTLTITHGDLIAIVWDLTAEDGVATDAVRVSSHAGSLGLHLPAVSLRTGGSWAAVTNYPNVLITADNGTLIWLDGATHYTSNATTAINTGTTPDEICTRFITPPVKVIVDGLWGYVSAATNAADAAFKLYSNPSTNPVEVASASMDANNFASTAVRFRLETLATAKTLAPNTEYAACLLPGSANNNQVGEFLVTSAAAMAVWPGGTSAYKLSRSDAGSFSATTTTRPMLGVKIRYIYGANP